MVVEAFVLRSLVSRLRRPSTELDNDVVVMKLAAESRGRVPCARCDCECDQCGGPPTLAPLKNCGASDMAVEKDCFSVGRTLVLVLSSEEWSEKECRDSSSLLSSCTMSMELVRRSFAPFEEEEGDSRSRRGSA